MNDESKDDDQPTPAKRKFTEILESIKSDSPDTPSKFRQLTPLARKFHTTESKSRPGSVHSTPVKSLPATPLNNKILTPTILSSGKYSGRRLGLGGWSEGRASVGPRGSRMSVSTPTKASSVNITTETPERRNRPDTYFPWSLSELLSRLSTYSFTNWTVRYLTGLECALQGYKCSDKNILECATCSCRLSVIMTGDKDNVDKTAAEKYRELLHSTHSRFCPWKQLACAKDLYKLPTVRSKLTKIVDSIYQTYNETGNHENNITNNDIASHILTCSPHIPETQLEKLPISDSHLALAKLSLLGWSHLDLPGVHAVSCDMCFRRVIIGAQTEINFATQHMSYCPYREWQVNLDILVPVESATTGETSRKKLARLKALYFERSQN